MSLSTEREFKRQLSAAQAAAIQQAYPFAAPFSQTNIYYDTPEQTLKKAQAALRLRCFTDHAEVTLKQRQGDGLRTMLETTDTISYDSAQVAMTAGTFPPTPSVTTALTQLGIALTQLRPFASVTTTRREAKEPAGTLVLDHSHFADQTADWELEMEYTDFALAAPFFDALTQKFQLPDTAVQNKVARAVQHMPN